MADNGSGHFGGNGSVYWRSVHSATHNPGRNIRRWNGSGAAPALRDWVRVGDQGGAEVLGHDGVALDDVGVAGEKGKFKIVVRYTTDPNRAVGATIAGVAAVPSGTTTDKAGALNADVKRQALRAVAIQELQRLIESASAAIEQLEVAPPDQNVDVTVQFFVPVMRRTQTPNVGEWEVTVDW